MGYADYGGGARPAGQTCRGWTAWRTCRGWSTRPATSACASLDTPKDRPRRRGRRPHRPARQPEAARRGRASRATRSTAPRRARRSRRRSASSSRCTCTTRTSPGGIAIHWHGVDVPNAEDGVSGITQNAIKAGKDYTYRWVAPHAGTFWYHSHQVSHEQVVPRAARRDRDPPAQAGPDVARDPGTGAPLRRRRDGQRSHGRPGGGRETWPARPRPRDQHRQRPAGHLDLAAPSGCCPRTGTT